MARSGLMSDWTKYVSVRLTCLCLRGLSWLLIRAAVVVLKMKGQTK